MDRRNFIRGLLTAAAGFSILPAAATYARQWIEKGALIVPKSSIQMCQFRQIIIDQEPLYDRVILEMRSRDGWLHGLSAKRFMLTGFATKE